MVRVHITDKYRTKIDLISWHRVKNTGFNFSPKLDQNGFSKMDFWPKSRLFKQRVNGFLSKIWFAETSDVFTYLHLEKFFWKNVNFRFREKNGEIWLLQKFLIFDQNFDFDDKFWMFEQNLDLYHKYLSKILKSAF